MKLKAHIDAELSHPQTMDLADRLRIKRSELSDRVADLERQIVLKDDCSLADAAEAASLQETRLRARGIAEQHRRILNEIDAAFRRLENGSYGISEASGEPIAYGRLQLVPWTRTAAED